MSFKPLTRNSILLLYAKVIILNFSIWGVDLLSILQSDSPTAYCPIKEQ